MTALRFEVLGAEAVRFALVPTLAFRVGIGGAPGQRIQSMVLRCQIRVEPEQRRYDGGEQGRLEEIFGEPQRWSDTVKPFPWAHLQAAVGPFEEWTEVSVPVECSYDLEVTAGKYFHALAGGEVPLLFLFSGTVFRQGPGGLSASQIPWDREARYRLPVALWSDLMDTYFPGSGWLLLDRATIDALGTYKARLALPTWDEAVRSLLASTEPSASGSRGGELGT